MSNFLLEAGRQTLMLELQEASRLPERLGDDFIRAAETIIHCEGKLVVSGIGKSGHIGKNWRPLSPVPAPRPFSSIRRRRCTAISGCLMVVT